MPSAISFSICEHVKVAVVVFEILCRPGADTKMKPMNMTFHYMLHFILLKAREGEVKLL